MTKHSLGKTQHGDEWWDVDIKAEEARSLADAIEMASAEIEVVRAAGKADGLGYWAQGPIKGTKVYGP